MLDLDKLLFLGSSSLFLGLSMMSMALVEESVDGPR